jgi:hypothetical protein
MYLLVSKGLVFVMVVPALPLPKDGLLPVVNIAYITALGRLDTVLGAFTGAVQSLFQKSQRGRGEALLLGEAGLLKQTLRNNSLTPRRQARREALLDGPTTMSFDVVLLDTHHSDPCRTMTETVTEASFPTVPHGSPFPDQKPPPGATPTPKAPVPHNASSQGMSCPRRA